MRKLFLIIFLALSGAVLSQDSVKNKAQDSALDANQLQSQKLLQMADSAYRADSIEQAELQAQLEQLRSSDRAAKERLQRKLDSLKTAKDQRLAEEKARIDDLRSSTPGVPVVFYHDTLFRIYAKLGPFSPSERALRIQKKIELLADDPTCDVKAIQKFQTEDGFDLMYGEVILMSITDRDAFWLDKSKEDVADLYLEEIRSIITTYKDETGIYKSLMRIFLLLLVIVILYFMVRFLNKGFSRLVLRIGRTSDKYMKGIKLGNYEFLSPERELRLVFWILNLFKWLLIVLIMYISLPVIFSIFPTTEGVARMLLGYVTTPLFNMIRGIVGYIPELITIIVISTATHYFIKFLKFLASEIETGKLVISGFYSDWAKPTFNLLKVIIIAFAFIMIFPYLPGSDSPVFQGVSVFLGLLISLGSSSAISNIIAGLVITYMRPFKLGDRVKIGDTVGDVIEKNMLVTRLRTIKNEDISLPNSSVLNGSTVNYSSSAKDLGLILHATVTIGYDVPWKQVHELLISAASKCDLIKQDPKPFVLQTSLDDFYVSYQINAYTEHANKGAVTYSNLYANIQDAFNEAGVEILSPHYRAQRDGNMVTIPANYLPPDYVVPAFGVKMKNDKDVK